MDRFYRGYSTSPGVDANHPVKASDGTNLISQFFVLINNNNTYCFVDTYSFTKSPNVAYSNLKNGLDSHVGGPLGGAANSVYCIPTFSYVYGTPGEANLVINQNPPSYFGNVKYSNNYSGFPASAIIGNPQNNNYFFSIAGNLGYTIYQIYAPSLDLSFGLSSSLGSEGGSVTFFL